MFEAGTVETKFQIPFIDSKDNNDCFQFRNKLFSKKSKSLLRLYDSYIPTQQFDRTEFKYFAIHQKTEKKIKHIKNVKSIYFT